MAKKCPKCECPAGEKWAVPFADFLSLLLALFIALYALASVNIEKQKALKEEFVKIYSFNTLSQTLAEPEENEQTATTDQEKEKSELGKDSNFEKAMEYIGGIVENPDMYGYMSAVDNLKLFAKIRNINYVYHIIHILVMLFSMMILVWRLQILKKIIFF